MSNESKVHLLFVDDETNILQGLKRMLRSVRKEWDMSFADGGEAALAVLAEKNIDIIVSDMRMPGMDGAELLARAKDRYPHTVRFILSGHADKEMIVRTIGPTHQYFAKPCNADVLKSAVTRVQSLRTILQDEHCRSLVAGLNNLPSRPAKFDELAAELQSETPDKQQVLDIISSDAGMTARVLQLVSSSFFGFRDHFASPAEATSFLGIDTLQTLFKAEGIFSKVNPDTQAGFDFEGVWLHSLAVAELSAKIAAELDEDKRFTEDAYMGGLMHDIGRLVIAANMPDQAAEIAALVGSQQVPLLEAERRILSATHGEIGAYLLGLWGLPDPLVQALAYHHNPSDSLGEQSKLLVAVHAADALVQYDRDGQERSIATPVDERYLEKAGVIGLLPAWRELSNSITLAGAPV